MAEKSGGSKKKSAAQLRRMAKRAVARGESIPEACEPPAVAPAEPSSTAPTKMNAKERRLARRAAERDGSAVPEGDDAATSSVGPGKEWENAAPNPHVVFIGQLPFSATAEEVKLHFTEGAQIPENHVKVRLLTDSTSGKSKGMAFLEVVDAEEQFRALALHRSYFGHAAEKRRRQINVEKSSGGGKNAKRKRIAENRLAQTSFMESTVTRIIDEHVERGTISRKVLESDKHLMTMLKKCDASTVDQSLEEFAEKDTEELTNPAAWLTAIVCRKLAESFDNKVRGEHSGTSSSSNSKKQRGTGTRGSGHEGDPNYRTTQNDTSGSLSHRFPSLSARGRGERRGSSGR
jgi:RNA recognition motif-containing protein